MERKKRVLIISPSLNPEENISGISSMTNLLIACHRTVDYIHFIQGKKDNEKRGFKWILKQVYTPIRLIRILQQHTISYIHFNIGFEPFSLYRDIIIYSILYRHQYPLVLHIHGGRYTQSLPVNKLLKKIILRFLEKASLIIVLNQVEKTFLLNNYSFLSDSRVHVLPNAIDSKSTDIFTQKKQEDTKLNILYLGRIDKNKGLSLILEALVGLKEKNIDFTFYIGGVGPDTEWFVHECNQQIPNNYIYKGLVSGDNKQNLFAKSHVFLLPSRFEGLPMALLESMNNRIVPVVTPVGAIPEVVYHGQNGFLVNDKQDIITILELLSKDKITLNQLGENARNTITSRFSMTSYIENFDSILAGL